MRKLAETLGVAEVRVMPDTCNASDVYAGSSCCRILAWPKTFNQAQPSSGVVVHLLESHLSPKVSGFSLFPWNTVSLILVSNYEIDGLPELRSNYLSIPW